MGLCPSAFADYSLMVVLLFPLHLGCVSRCHGNESVNTAHRDLNVPPQRRRQG